MYNDSALARRGSSGVESVCYVPQNSVCNARFAVHNHVCKIYSNSIQKIGTIYLRGNYNEMKFFGCFDSFAGHRSCFSSVMLFQSSATEGFFQLTLGVQGLGVSGGKCGGGLVSLGALLKKCTVTRRQFRHVSALKEQKLKKKFILKTKNFHI